MVALPVWPFPQLRMKSARVITRRFRDKWLLQPNITSIISAVKVAAYGEKESSPPTLGGMPSFSSAFQLSSVSRLPPLIHDGGLFRSFLRFLPRITWLRISLRCPSTEGFDAVATTKSGAVLPDAMEVAMSTAATAASGLPARGAPYFSRLRPRVCVNVNRPRRRSRNRRSRTSGRNTGEKRESHDRPLSLVRLWLVQKLTPNFYAILKTQQWCRLSAWSSTHHVVYSGALSVLQALPVVQVKSSMADPSRRLRDGILPICRHRLRSSAGLPMLVADAILAPA